MSVYSIIVLISKQFVAEALHFYNPLVALLLSNIVVRGPYILIVL